jgi:arylsulfatase A-like enzyme
MKSLGFLFAAAGMSSVQAAEKPNILWIVTDDQRPDSLACYNEAVHGSGLSPLGYVMSPNIDRLAAKGTLFSQAYCNSPACSPSRASMHTGQYPFRNGIYGFEQAHQAADPSRRTIPQVMREAGYKTVSFGKHGYYIFKWAPGLTWTVENQYDLWVDKKNDLKKNGATDFSRNVVWGSGGKVGTEEIFYFSDGSMERYWVERNDGQDIAAADFATRKKVEGQLDILRAYTRQDRDMIIGGQSPQPPEKTLDGQIVNALVHYLENKEQTAEPLFVHLGFHFPHTPVLPPKEFRDLFIAKEKEIPYSIPAFDSKEIGKMPPQLQNLHKVMNFSDMQEADKLQAIRDYYAFCAHGDAQIGRSINAFMDYNRKTGREWIVVLVCGDHGWHLGEQGIEAKFGPWRQSSHVAIVASSSIVGLFPKGVHNTNLVELVDLAPTFYTAAGIDVGKEEYDYLDGVSLQKSVKGEHRDYILGEINHVVGPRAYLRTKDFAFSMKTRRKDGKPGDKWGHKPGEEIQWALECPREEAQLCLYDLRVDIGEHWNVADNPDYVALADWFRQKLGSIVLGDRRAEIDWSQENEYVITDFALGTDDKKLNFPEGLVPAR